VTLTTLRLTTEDLGIIPGSGKIFFTSLQRLEQRCGTPITEDSFKRNGEVNLTTNLQLIRMLRISGAMPTRVGLTYHDF
jgi:hypothetical protein